MIERLNPFRAALNSIRIRLNRTRPCPHENADTRLGNGEIWAKCEDCGDTFQQANWDAARQRAKEHDEAVELADDLHDAVREVWMIATRRKSTAKADFVKTCGHAFTPAIGAKLVFESEQAAKAYLEDILVPQIPKAMDYYEVVPAYVTIL
jgi:ribosomal protein L37AE/L43A